MPDVHHPQAADQVTARATSPARLLCAIGLLLTVVEVNGFGFDFANDTLGFALVGVGATRLADGAGRALALLAAASATVAAANSLFTYGGPAGQVLPATYRLWTVAFYVEVLATAGVVTGLLLLAWRARPVNSRRLWSALPSVVAAELAAAVLLLVLFSSDSAYFGALGYLRQAVAALLGVIQR